MFVSEEYARILGLPERQRRSPWRSFDPRSGDDYARISAIVTESVRDGLSMRAEFRVSVPTAQPATSSGLAIPVGVGSVKGGTSITASSADITSQRAAEDAMRVAQADLAQVSGPPPSDS